MLNATIVVTKKTDIWDELRRIDASASKIGLDPLQKSTMLRAVEADLRAVLTASSEIFERGVAASIKKVTESEYYRVKIEMESSAIDFFSGFKKVFRG